MYGPKLVGRCSAYESECS